MPLLNSFPIVIPVIYCLGVVTIVTVNSLDGDVRASRRYRHAPPVTDAPPEGAGTAQSGDEPNWGQR